MMRSIIILAIIVIGCNSKTRIIKEFIPGMYSRHFETLYSRGDDTLFISPMDDGNTYFIVRKSYFQRLHNNQLLEPEQTTENWSAIYNARDRILYEQKKERMLSFIPDSNKLLVGGSAYYKIK